MTLISLDSAQELVFAACPVIAPATVAVADALGCVTADDIRAEHAIPPFANTAMDGYAVRAVDTVGAPVDLDVIGTLAAGAPPTLVVGAGQAVRIMTGAPIPDGADSIVMVERTSSIDDGRKVCISVSAEAGDHVRAAGEDVTPGQVVFTAGSVLGAGHLGVLASLGLSTVVVYPRAVVGVLSTGDELIDGSSATVLGPGQIRDSNRPTLLALLKQSGCVAIDLGICPDDEERLSNALRDGAKRCDALLTSGGVSVGDFDYVKVVLDRLCGATMHWMQVAIKPAKPFAFGTIGGVPIFGLPGNSVSSMVSFECFARPALRQMMGHGPVSRPRVLAVADEDLVRHPDGKLHLVRVVASWSGADGRMHVRSSGPQASNLLRTMALANALALVPDGDGIAAGKAVEVLVLEPG